MKGTWRGKVFILAASGALLFLSGGCSDVAIRPGLPDYMSKLAVPIFQNRTVQPDIANDITQQLIQDFLVDGRMTLTEPEKARAILQGTVVRYILEPLLLNVHNTPQQYKMRIIMRLSLKDNQAGKALWTEESFEESTTYYVANSLGITPEDEQTARRRLILQLTKRIVARVIEGF